MARDRHCTFPGCDRPPTWCAAHHVIHWIDGGKTALLNAALLCERHHTIVHRDNLVATITTADVTWDPTPNPNPPTSATGYPHTAEGRKPADSSEVPEPPDSHDPQRGTPDGDDPQRGAPDGDEPQGGAPDGDEPQGGAPDGDEPQGGAPDGDEPPDDDPPQDGTPQDDLRQGDPLQDEPLWDDPPDPQGPPGDDTEPDENADGGELAGANEPPADSRAEAHGPLDPLAAEGPQERCSST